ncbi:hypothetical protein [Streptomyces sp. A30]|uniref:hypothetical protein n=1 Tax=Streptomyces sp. A30 TaxID=2789273 RepID=UPI00397E9BD6
MKGVFTRIRDRLARKRARPDTQGSSTDAVEPIGVTEPTAISESSEIAESAPVADPLPTNASIVFVAARQAPPPAEPTGPLTPAHVLPERKPTGNDVVLYTLHMVMSSDSALKNFCKAVAWTVLVICLAVAITASALYGILHLFAPSSAPSLRPLLVSVFGFGVLGILIVWVGMRIRRRPKADPAIGDGTAPSTTVTPGTEPVPRTPDAGPAPGSETGGRQP